MLDKKLLSILVCPQCKGEVAVADNGGSITCKACQLKYPVREDIPVMLVEEAMDLKSGRSAMESRTRSDGSVAAFKVISGPNKGLTFHVERSTCKAIGRAINDPNKTAMFSNVDISLALDDNTRGLVKHYVGRQFKDAKSSVSDTGSFKRTSDVILDDASISRLHAMIFFGDSGVGILDMVSRNGTFVNGEEVESRIVKKGDAIELGETKIIYEG